MLTLHPRAVRATARTFFVALVLALGAAPTHQATAADQPAMTQAPKKLMYSRLYTSADGNSHFADEELPLAKSGSPGAEGSLAVNRLGDIKGAMVASLPAGATEDWHVAPRRQFMFCLRGIVEVTAGDGTKRRIKPGEFLLLEDLTGKGHVTHSAGTEDHVALAIPVLDGVPAKK